MNEMPVTVKRSIELLGLVLIGYIITIGKGIIMPIAMAFFISIMLLPIYQFLTGNQFGEGFSADKEKCYCPPQLLE